MAIYLSNNKFMNKNEMNSSLSPTPEKEQFIKGLDNKLFLSQVIKRHNLKEIKALSGNNAEVVEQLFKPIGLWWEIDQLRIKDVLGNPAELPERVAEKITEALHLYMKTLESFNVIREKRHKNEDITEQDINNTINNVHVLYDYLESILSTELKDKFIQNEITESEEWISENDNNSPKAQKIAEQLEYLKSKK